MHDRFQKDMLFFIKSNTSSSYESRNQTEQTQERKRDNKKPIRKQHKDNKTQENTCHKGGKREKERKKQKVGGITVNETKNSYTRYDVFLYIPCCFDQKIASMAEWLEHGLLYLYQRNRHNLSSHHHIVHHTFSKYW